MKLGQQLKMTPQLQQAIRLLQLSTMELSQEIQLALDSNPMLEADEEFQNSDNELAEAERDIDLSVMDGNDAIDEFAETTEAEVSEQFEEPLTESMPSDSTWDDIYPQSGTGTNVDNDFDPSVNNSAAEGLLEHLEWQLNLTPMAASDRAIASMIIDSIDDNGMLTASLEDICASLIDPARESDEQPTLEDVETVLHKIQQFDPVGVGARDLREAYSCSWPNSTPKLLGWTRPPPW